MAKTKSKKALSEDEATLKTVIAGLEKNYGAGIIQTLSGPLPLQRFTRQIPSGSISLDIAMGAMYRHSNGIWQTGYAPGRMIEIFGDESTGKTTMCLQLIANAQAMGIRCAYGDMEHTVDPNYAKKLGVDLSKLQLYQPASGTNCLQITETLIRSGLFGLIIVDSVASLITDAELAGEVGDRFIGEQARLMSSSLKSMNTFMSGGAHTTLVFTNQIREKVGVVFGSPKTTPGGRALKFYASMRIELYRVCQLKEGENVYGQRICAHIIKNKSAPPFRKAEFDLVFGKGIDAVADLLDLCVGRGLVGLNGSWYTMGDVRLGQGRHNAIEYLRGDRQVCYQLYDKLLTIVLAERGYNADGSEIPGMHLPESAPRTIASTFQPESPKEDPEESDNPDSAIAA
jgi:recombination protein RecA